MPKEEEEPNSILKYQEVEGKYDLLDDPLLKSFLGNEISFVQQKFKIKQTVEEEEIDIIIRWSIPYLGIKGFYSLFKVGLMKKQKLLT